MINLADYKTERQYKTVFFETFVTRSQTKEFGNELCK